jgi:phosphoserine phosphatase
MIRPVVATLAPAQGERLSDALLSRAVQAAGVKDALRIDESAAADLYLEEVEPLAAIRDRLRDAVLGEGADVIVQLAATRRKRLLICDMDSTMIGQECIDELADFAGVRAEVSEVTERAMRGEIDFEVALKSRVALLKGLPVSVVDAVLADRITLTPGGPELVRTMRANGAITALVSGGFTLFTGPLAGRIGFAIHRANVLEIEADRFTGTVRQPILGQDAKRRSLMELATGNIALEETMAVGDGANDLAMIEAAGLGVAYRAKPAVAAAADARLDHADLSALLYAQGYCKADFAA